MSGNDEINKFLSNPKVSNETKFLAQYLEKYVTETICRKIDEKDKEIQRLSTELEEIKKKVKKQEENIIQKYEIEPLRNSSEKDFLVLSGPGVLRSEETAAKIVRLTLSQKTSTNLQGINLALENITEARKIPVKNPTTNVEGLIVKFKLPHASRVEVTQKLAEIKPDIYLNEALSTLKGKLLQRIRKIKKTIVLWCRTKSNRTIGITYNVLCTHSSPTKKLMAN